MLKKARLLTLTPHVRENAHSTEFVLASVRPSLWKGASREIDCEAIRWVRAGVDSRRGRAGENDDVLNFLRWDC